jgi:hypothetical protein
LTAVQHSTTTIFGSAGILIHSQLFIRVYKLGMSIKRLRDGENVGKDKGKLPPPPEIFPNQAKTQQGKSQETAGYKEQKRNTQMREIQTPFSCR